MGRKGVSKRKKAKVKAGPVSESISALTGRKTENQPEQVTEKGKAWPRDNKKR
jgi:hypothetical protein